ncbi:MAG: hypothetical protein J6R85_00145, partial [Lentisphaeria bacterium]|nr:hypothetical protein [Lentisphaeria bacterium]
GFLGDKDNFFSCEKKFSFSPKPPFLFKKSSLGLKGKPPCAGSGAGMSVYGVRITETFSDVSNLFPSRSKRLVMLKRHIAAKKSSLGFNGKPPYAGSGAGMSVYGVRIFGGIGGKREITRKNASDHTGAMQ